MATSGIKVSDEIKAYIEDLGTTKKDVKQIVAFCLKISDCQKSFELISDSLLYVDNEGASMPYDHLLRFFKDKECVYGFMCVKIDQAYKKVLLNWAPNDANIRKKMVHTSSVSALKKELKFVELHDAEDKEIMYIMDKLEPKNMGNFTEFQGKQVKLVGKKPSQKYVYVE